MGNCSNKSAGGPAGGSADGLGQFLAEFAADNEGQLVASELQGTTECWDLAMAAVEHAQKAGYGDIDWDPDNSYQWGPNTVDLADAQTGDIVQWSSYQEQHEGYSRYTAYHHTSIVAEDYDGEVFKNWGQNPHPVELAEYHPDSCTGGSFIIYRLSASGDGNGDSGNKDDGDDDGNSGNDGYTYYDSSNGPYYWKACDGYDPWKDGYYWYPADGTPDDAQWYSYN
jgi:hypothetical protein